MAGHSHAANIKHRKGAQDEKKSKIFTKLQREISSAAKQSGADAAMNPRLRLAISKARELNMPKDKIEFAIQRATKDASFDNYEEIRYLIYISSVAILVETLSDNKNRTAGEVRAAATKYGGSLGDSGAIDFTFSRLGIIQYKVSEISNFDDFFEFALQNGADDIQEEVTENAEGEQVKIYEIKCEMKVFMSLKTAVEAKYGDPYFGSLVWIPNTPIAADDATKERIYKVLDVLEDMDDVQNAISSME